MCVCVNMCTQVVIFPMVVVFKSELLSGKAVRASLYPECDVGTGIYSTLYTFSLQSPTSSA